MKAHSKLIIKNLKIPKVLFHHTEIKFSTQVRVHLEKKMIFKMHHLHILNVKILKMKLKNLISLLILNK